MFLLQLANTYNCCFYCLTLLILTIGEHFIVSHTVFVVSHFDCFTIDYLYQRVSKFVGEKLQECKLGFQEKLCHFGCNSFLIGLIL